MSALDPDLLARLCDIARQNIAIHPPDSEDVARVAVLAEYVSNAYGLDLTDPVVAAALQCGTDLHLAILDNWCEHRTDAGLSMMREAAGLACFFSSVTLAALDPTQRPA